LSSRMVCRGVVRDAMTGASTRCRDPFIVGSEVAQGTCAATPIEGFILNEDVRRGDVAHHCGNPTRNHDETIGCCVMKTGAAIVSA
jgi:hypothetical protein